MKKNRIAFSVYLTTFIGMFLITARSVMLPAMMEALQGMKYYNLAVMINSLAMCLVLPVSGRLSDIYGRKRIYVTGAFGYAGACLVCGCATQAGVLLAGLFATGICFGLMNAVQLAVILDLFSREEQIGRVSNLTIANSLACFSAPALAGAFADYLSWRLVYLLMIPFSLWIGFVMLRCLPKEKRQKAEKIKVLELLIPYRLFQYRTYVFCIVSYLICSIGFAGMNYLPVFYQQVKGVSVLISGFLILPRQAAQIGIGMALKKKGQSIRNVKNAMLASFGIFVLTFVLMWRYQESTGFWYILLAEVLFGVSNAAITIISQTFCSKELNTQESGSGTAFIGFIGAFGNTAGAVLGSAILSMQGNTNQGIPQIFGGFALLMAAGGIFCKHLPCETGLWKK